MPRMASSMARSRCASSLESRSKPVSVSALRVSMRSSSRAKRSESSCCVGPSIMGEVSHNRLQGVEREVYGRTGWDKPAEIAFFNAPRCSGQTSPLADEEPVGEWRRNCSDNPIAQRIGRRFKRRRSDGGRAARRAGHGRSPVIGERGSGQEGHRRPRHGRGRELETGGKSFCRHRVRCMGRETKVAPTDRPGT